MKYSVQTDNVRAVREALGSNCDRIRFGSEFCEWKIPSLKEMLEAGVHFGHQSSRWNPKMRSFIFGRRNRVHVIDLEKTQVELEKALDFLQKQVKQGKQVLFVGTKPQAKSIVKEAAIKCGMPYIVERWLGGTFTNFATISKQTKELKKLEKDKETGEFAKYTKKEASILEDKIKRLENFLGGVKEMNQLPGAIFVVDVIKEKNAVKEAGRKEVPIVALADTNADPDLINYPIPANDDAFKSVKLMVDTVANAIAEVNTQLKKQPAEKVVKGEKTETKIMREEKETKAVEKEDKEKMEEVMDDLEAGI